MILDVDHLKSTEPIICDICIVGSGPAAISLALQFLKTDTRVVMAESGGLNFERGVQRLYRGESIGYPLPSGLEGSRTRHFGGSSNCWAGACTPLDDIDFRKRDWVPNSGWPIGPESISPYVERAQKVCLVGPYVYDSRIVEGNPDWNFDFSPDTLEMGYWQFSSEPRLGKHYHDHFKNSANITVLLHATVTAIDSNPSANHVSSVTVSSLRGSKTKIRATTYVLACGGIENARLLLASNSVVQQGLGNSNGMVGRYFMEHPVCVSATVVPRRKADPRLDFLNVFHEPTPLFAGTRFNALIKTTEVFQRNQKILNSAIFIVNHDSEFSQGLMAAVRMRQALQERRIPQDMSEDMLKILADFPNVLTAAYGRYFNYGHSRARLGLKIQAETVPDPESRVTLSTKTDAFGMPLARLNWRLNALDRRTMDVLIQEVTNQFDRLNIADINLDHWMVDGSNNLPGDMRGGVHHTGTTRMSIEAKDGVVDINCRMHEVDNLYVAGSSVFPTNSWANPTWMISCLALRLADHLLNSLGK